MRKLYLISLACSFSILISCQTQPVKPDVELEISNILNQLTLKEKVDLCHAQSKFSSKGVPRLGVPELWMSDGPHGVRAEIAWDNWGSAGWTDDSCTAFPALTCLAATFNEDLALKYGVAIGEEARYREKDVLLGPGVNIYRTPMNGRNFEYMGEDPFLASKMVVPYIHGVQQNGVAACVKHFALNNQELWRDRINVHVSDRALREIYLPAYKAAVQKGGVWAVMGSYNQYEGEHCCHNNVLINKILKGEWGFDGAVISDWGGVHNTDQAALNGMDIEMGTGTDGLSVNTKNAYDKYYLALPFYQKLKGGEISEAVVNDKARRVLRLNYRTAMNKEKPFGSKGSKEHSEVDREVGQQGVVLLKNENKFFPIDTQAKLKIAVIGQNAVRPMTVGGGSSELKALYEISPLDGIKNRFKNAEINFSLGYAAGRGGWMQEFPSPLNADSLKQAALETVKGADLVLFIGGLNKNPGQDCEGMDRRSYNLTYGQDELLADILKVNQNVGVILISGNAVAMPWVNDVKGIMQAWYLGSEAGNVIADIISGDKNPSGKLPFTFPVKLDDNGAMSFGELSYPGDGKDEYYKEGIYVGYRWNEKKEIKPLFAFGYGLSYTTFEIKNCNLVANQYSVNDKLKVSCTVNNTGIVDGAEVVQVYIGKIDSKVDRAVKELKGFKKVDIKAHGSADVAINIDINDLAFWNEKTNSWEVEKGKYFAAIGNSSDQITDKIEFTVE